MKSHSRKADVVIIGGGASGLAAAIALRMSAKLEVLVIEKLDEPARKIRATGSGRCNITNTEADGYLKVVGFFTRIGLVTKSYENGLVYPYSESAADVAEILIARANQLGVKFACGEEVVSVSKAEDSGDKGGFAVVSKNKDAGGEHETSTEARFVILACGGKAGPMFGTTGDGYRIARSLGHSIVTPVPVLTGIECAEWDKEHSPCAVSLAGTRSRGVVSLYKHGDEIFEEEGEIQFTKYGLSGICVFNMTRHMRFDAAGGESLSDFLITADLFPGRDIGKVLRTRRDRAFPHEKACEVLRGVLKENVAGYVLGSVSPAGMDAADKDIREITDKEIAAIGNAVHSMTFHPLRLRGWKDAQATAGGVSLPEIDEETSASKLVNGLYITGELADRDYQCGGFNLNNAWLSGLRAAEDILKLMCNDEIQTRADKNRNR